MGHHLIIGWLGFRSINDRVFAFTFSSRQSNSSLDDAIVSQRFNKRLKLVSKRVIL